MKTPKKKAKPADKEFLAALQNRDNRAALKKPSRAAGFFRWATEHHPALYGAAAGGNYKAGNALHLGYLEYLKEEHNKPSQPKKERNT